MSGVQEVSTLGKDVQLGWIYNSSSWEFSPPKDQREYISEEHLSYECNIFNKCALEKFSPDSSSIMFRDSVWYKDYKNSSAQDMIKIQLIKVNEIRACDNIDISSDQKVTTSILYKAYLDLLFIYDDLVPGCSKDCFKDAFDNIILGNEAFLHTCISSGIKELNLYDGNMVNKSTNIVGILNEACRLLKDKKMERPVAVLISNGSQTENSEDKPVPNAVSYAQIASNSNIGSTLSVKNPFRSNSSKHGHLNNSVPVKVHSSTKSPDLIDEIVIKLLIKEESQTEVKSQSQIPYKKEMSKNCPKAPLNNSHDSIERASRKHTPQASDSIDPHDSNNKTRYALRDRSKSSKRVDPNNIRENQEFLTNRGGIGSRGRGRGIKLSHEQKVDILTQIKSPLPPIPVSLVARNLNNSSHVTRGDIFFGVNSVDTVNDKNNILVTKQKNINHSCQDQSSLISDHLKYQDKEAFTCIKTSNVNSEIYSNNAVDNSIMTSNPLYHNGTVLESSCNNANLAAHSQDSSNLFNTGQTSQCYITSPGHTNKSFKTIRSLKLLTPSKILMDPCGMKRHYYGNISSNIEEKVILLLGASGSGKTTLVNFIANFFEGVKTADDEKVIIASTLEKTKEITAYSFSTEKDTGTLVTLIDTPGLNDSSGSEIRDHVNSLKTFLANTAAHGLKIHALGFVAQAHLGRLTSSERLVMDYVSTLFGEGVKDNIITLISFADVQESPPVVEAIKNYGIKTKHFLKFNNAVLNGSSVEVDEIDRVYWRTGYRSWKKGMKILNDLLPLSINAMKTLQNEIYTKSVVENSVKHFNAELIEFFSIYDQGNPKEIRNSSHKVWDLATVAHYHLKQTPEGSVSVETLLFISVEKSCCVSVSVNPSVYLRALSYYSPRGIDNCARAIIASINPMYVSARNIQFPKETKKCVLSKKKKSDKDFLQANYHGQERLYCHQCQQDHSMERIEDDGMIDALKKTFGYKQAAMITYKCTECKCEGNVHGVNPLLNSGSIPNSSGSYKNDILYHTKYMLSNVVKMCSLPNINMTEKDLLKFLLRETKTEANEFVNALLEVS